MSARPSRIVGLIVGSILVIGSIIAIFFMDWSAAPPQPEVPIRPIKTFVVESAFSAGARRYPGKVAANEEVDLAFQVAGPLIELPVLNGQKVEAGQVIARIDPRDFQSELDSTKATMVQTRERFERLTKLRESDAANEMELIRARSEFERAESDLAIKQKALDDTTLKAPFAGTVARRYVENFQNVQAKEQIVRLQDDAVVEVRVNIPEQRATQVKKDKDSVVLVATFEYLPGRTFDVTVKEYSTEADPLTQTFEVTLVMPAPKDVRILPGMTATVMEFEKDPATAETTGYAVPLALVPVDGTGGYFVWKIEPGEGEISTVRRVDVQVGEMVDDQILVTEGLSKGDRIAAAGVTLLHDGQQVRILHSKSERANG